ncbi:hypothetical protein [Flavobacterium terrisoli]|uniref:hypothetical protein n=1 Tax=Flavobacterium terrisoli TaxID=3242195 RepID=UPI002543BBA3|nr:hypothetical protein [Flavobacterium buctense]
MKTKLFYLFLGAFTLTMISCETENNSDSNTNNAASKQNIVVTSTSSDLPENSPCITTTLIAGQRYNAGDIRVYFDNDKVYVEYETAGNWYIRKTHLYIGDCALIPVNRRGEPIPGHFPFRGTQPSGTQVVVYAMDKANLPKCFCISAHADVYRMVNGQVVQSETAWAQGERFTQSSWGMFMSVCEDDCPN